MKVHELIKELSELDPEAPVFVSCRSAAPSIGASPAAAITHAVMGFDWNHGRAFIATDPMLTRDFERMSLKGDAFGQVIDWYCARDEKSLKAFPRIVENIVKCYLKKTGQPDPREDVTTETPKAPAR